MLMVDLLQELSTARGLVELEYQLAEEVAPGDIALAKMVGSLLGMLFCSLIKSRRLRHVD